VKHRITLIPGDGIGPEVTQPTLKIIKAAGVNIEWETHVAGAAALKSMARPCPSRWIRFVKIGIRSESGDDAGGPRKRRREPRRAQLMPICVNQNLPGAGALSKCRPDRRAGKYRGLFPASSMKSSRVMEVENHHRKKPHTRIAKFAFNYAR
jgi:isocitrate dehydrogenase (NAD+)